MRTSFLVGAVLAATIASHAAKATTFTFTTVDVPGAESTALSGINNQGLAVGTFVKNGQQVGFLRASDGTIATFSVAGLPTSTGGINDLGQVVGSLSNGQDFIRNTDGSLITFSVPDNGPALDINNGGTVVGYHSAGNVCHGFVRSPGGALTDLDDPSSAIPNTVAQGINDQGEIVGNFNFETNAFLRDAGGTFTNFQFPGAIGQTAAFGINDAGDIVGFYDIATNHGFLRHADGTFETVDDPLRGKVSQVTGINDKGVLVGLFTDASGAMHGYIATPLPEPGTLALFITLAGAGFYRRTARRGFRQ